MTSGISHVLRCFGSASYLLQIGEIEKLTQFLLELRLGDCLVIQKLHSVLLHLEEKQQGRGQECNQNNQGLRVLWRSVPFSSCIANLGISGLG